MCIFHVLIAFELDKDSLLVLKFSSETNLHKKEFSRFYDFSIFVKAFLCLMQEDGNRTETSARS